MASPQRIYGGAVRLLSFLFIALGIAILASTLANGGGPLSIGAVMGVAFVAVGLVRLWGSGLVRGWRRGRGGSDG